ncbi:cystathionine beta-lyase [Microbacterium mangrovi]|uniref:cysteine-S-conjugate beta-lyase n=1 Tax=Microbacterium mangrovi TaxID=1348253 RepID=A0A0B2A503_9MICO|nr:aminotransferase class I/II-fold pyridoxal phosphate-dependent enzyme [Microbacterium mangrovi]KHK98594.1 cystathionine beta-lyase [Microbacterium mangrovi]
MVPTSTLARVANPLGRLSLAQLRERTSTKWVTHPCDVIPLWVAEMDVPLAPVVIDALQGAIAAGDTGYPAGTRYAEALAAFASRRWGWDGLDVGRTRVVADVMTGIAELLRIVTDPGDEVVIASPAYSPFFAFIEHTGRLVREAPLGPDLRLDPESLDTAFAAAARRSRRPAFLLCNPHNPTGTVHTRRELEEVAAVAHRHGVRVISDEIHAPLVLAGARFTPYLSVAGAEDAFALTSASKAFNLAGLKAAVAMAGPAAAADLAAIPGALAHGPSHLGVIAHTAALERGGDWLDALLGGLAENRAQLRGLLAEHLPEVGMTTPEGTYLAWLDCRALGPFPDERTAGAGCHGVSDLAGPARMFLDRARVALSSGHVYGSGGSGHVRLNFATSSEILGEAVARMGRAVHA